MDWPRYQLEKYLKEIGEEETPEENQENEQTQEGASSEPGVSSSEVVQDYNEIIDNIKSLQSQQYATNIILCFVLLFTVLRSIFGKA